MRQIYLVLRAAAFLGLTLPTTAFATSINPLDDGGWQLVAHMSGSGGMFDGDCQLAFGYSFGVFDPNPSAATLDFERIFPVVAEEILFLTGDLSIWAIANYEDLRALIDAQGEDLSPNLAFEIGVDGVISNTTGNVLSRPGIIEDPWISMDGGHVDGVNNQRIVWGEDNYSAFTHQDLKNNNGGMNVYVRAVPEPFTGLLLGGGLVALAVGRRRGER